MRKVINKIAVLFCVLMLSFLLSGCDFFTVDIDSLVSPPELSGDIKPIEETLKKSVGQDYTLKYPASGKNRSAIILEDIDNNGEPEAIAFYSTKQGDDTVMHMGIIAKSGKKWKLTAETNLTAASIDKVDFADLDGDGKKEILAGWEIFGNSDKKLGVYTLENGTLSSRLMQKYTSFIVCDINGDKNGEIFIQTLLPGESQNRASLFSIADDGITQTAGCALDSGVKSAQEPIFTTLKSGEKAIFIDETKGIGAITEVLLCDNDGQLINPLLDEETNENLRTVRNSQIFCTDINSDGFLEIPVSAPLVNIDSEKVYYTDWCGFENGNLTKQMTTLTNVADGYYLKLPENLIGNIAVGKDVEAHKRTIYYYDKQNEAVGGKLFDIASFEKIKLKENELKNSGYTKIYENDATVIAVKSYENSNGLNVTVNAIREMFYIF